MLFSLPSLVRLRHERVISAAVFRLAWFQQTHTSSTGGAMAEWIQNECQTQHGADWLPEAGR